MTLPDLPLEYVALALGLIALAVGARYRLDLLLKAGSTPPGAARLSRAAMVYGLDTATFLTLCFIVPGMRRSPFALLLSAILVFSLTTGLLWVQWRFHRGTSPRPASPPPTRPPAGPPPMRPVTPAPPPSGLAGNPAAASAAAAGAAASAARAFRSGVQNVQDAALAAGYGQLEAMIKEKIEKNRWMASLVYQGIMVAICVVLRVLETLESGWLYMIFSVLWQSGVTAGLYWRIDRRAKPVVDPDIVNPAPPPAASGMAASAISSILGRLPYVPSGLTGGGSANARPPRPQRRKFALRSDVQAVVGFTAGLWCGLFSLLFGWVYGFASVAFFRSLLSLASPLASGLLRRYLPTLLPNLGLSRPARASLFSLAYLRSREFWYGPGMGLVGGLAGSVLRYVLVNR